MKKVVLLTAAVLGVLLFFGACSEAGDDTPSISVPKASELQNFTGTPPTDKTTAVATVQAVLGSVDTGASASMLPKGVKSTHTSVFLDATWNNVTEDGVTLNGYMKGVEEAKFADDNYPLGSSGDYYKVTLKGDVTGTMQSFTTTASVNSIPQDFTVSGSLRAIVDALVQLTMGTQSAKLSYSLKFGYGFGLSVSNADPAGPGGKFLLTVAYSDSDSVTITGEGDIPEDFGPGGEVPVTVTLKVYNNANQEVGSYVLTEAELDSLMIEGVEVSSLGDSMPF